MHKAYARCTEILKAEAVKLLAVADFLLEHDTMSRAQFEALMEDRPIPEKDSGFVFAAEEDRLEPAPVDDGVPAEAEAPVVEAEPSPDEDTSTPE